ncbi:hypothetical protein, partial [Mesorhizobium sp.]|uniref:hypothetical protein n=1 Tax=Mesorhizobium sp. TaxID=1871066 RepID=UPI0025C11BA5
MAIIMRFAFEYIQRDGAKEPDEVSWLTDAAGGAVYVRLSTRTIEQPRRDIDDRLAGDIVNG